MKNIAIFTSGDAAAAKRVTSLFNEGNRFRVVAVVAESPETLEDFRAIDPSLTLLSHSDWQNRPNEILEAFRDAGVDKIALDNLPKSILETMEEQQLPDLIILSDEENAPREVVAAFSESVPPTLPHSVASTPSVDEEWAATLKMEFNPEEAGEVPPPIPPDQQGENPQQTPQPFQQNPVYTHPQQNGNRQEPMPKSYLVWSVVMTVFCCLIPGIVAIIYSSQVSTKYYSGDLEGAKKASRNAEVWIIVSFVLGVLSATLTLPIALMG